MRSSQKLLKILGFIFLSIMLLNTILLISRLISAQQQIKEVQIKHIPLTEYNSIINGMDFVIKHMLEKSITNKDSSVLQNYLNIRLSMEDSLEQMNHTVSQLGSEINIQRSKLSFIESGIVNHIKAGQFKLAQAQFEGTEYQLEHRLFRDALTSAIEELAEKRDDSIAKLIQENEIIIKLAIALLFISFVSGAIVIFKANRSEKNRNLAYQLLLENVEQHRNMTRILSHDIANPLTSIILAAQRAELSKDGVTDKYWNLVQQGSQAIQAIIQDVREFDAVESGKKEIELFPVELAPLVAELNKDLENKLGEKKVTLRCKLENETLKVLGSQNIIKHQIFMNILTNAIKFSNPDTFIDLEVSEPNSKEVQVSIKDYGIGIPKDILEKLFDPTASTTRKGTSGEKGTGFGMPIMKSYIEKIQGHFTVESSTIAEAPMNHGTCFKIFFKKVS